MMEVFEVIDECPDEKYTVVTEYCANKDLDYTTRKYLNDINKIGVDEEVGENKFIENEDVINRDVTKNEPENNQDTLKKVIE